MSLSFAATVPERGFDLDFTVGEDEVLALMGPNGSGKSTALETLAGLVTPSRASILLSGQVLSDERSALAPHRRGVALLAQEPMLFPHLSVLDNVAFGPRSRGRSRSDARTIARDWLAEVEATPYADRRPGQLSGGQAQRVALARALAVDPHLLLLDEPLAALDVPVAAAMRQLLRRVLAGRSAVIVTHDVLDALLLADRVLVLEKGHRIEEGPTAEVLTRPRSAFAARIAGLNLVRGTWNGHALSTPEGRVVEGLVGETPSVGSDVVAVFRPSSVGVFRQAPGGSPRNVVATVVSELEPVGEQLRVRTEFLSADVTPAAVAELRLAPGTEVVLVVKASEVAIYPA